MTFALKNYQQRALGSLETFLERARLDGPATAFAATVDSALTKTYKPLPGLADVPYVCLRIPTGGGKTVMGAHIIQTAATAYLERDRPLVLWLVPTTQIKTQTLEAFRNPRHPYRMELDDAFDRKVEVFDIADIDQIKPDDLATKVCMVVSTIATARVGNTELRDIYAHKEALESHFKGAVLDLPTLKRSADGKVEFSFANLLMLHKPLVITDEAHNATTPLSFEVYTRLAPSAVIELTATPDQSSSNILISVGAFELKTENMIKLPVVLKEHNEAWTMAVSAAVARRRTLATLATAEPDYVRPLLLVQAENARGIATVAEVKQHLIEVDNVPANAIAIATGDQRELEGVDLFEPACPIEVIITKQALKEGWDCSFAYVFCSVAQVKSSTDVQQLLGRVLRMPYAKRRKNDALNKAYAHVVSAAFGEAAAELTKALGNVGFNPLEALQSIRRDEPPATLELTGGAVNAVPAVPSVAIAVTAAPDLSSVPERDQQHVTFVPHPDGAAGGTLTITDGVDTSTVNSILAVVPRAQRDTARTSLEDHQSIVQALRAPSERREVFTLPYLCIRVQGELELVEGGERGEDGIWDPLLHPADLTSFAFHEDSMTFEVDLDQRHVSYHYVKDDVATYLPGFAQEHTVTDLIKWLASKLHTRFVKPPLLIEWIRRAVDGLMTARGFSLAQLVRGQHVLRRKLQEQLDAGRKAAMASNFQRMLFAPEADVVSSPDAAEIFAFPPDLAQYPARSYYTGPYRFAKHYYPVPGDLRWQTDAGHETEEFQCARAIDTLDEVKFWTRNLVHRNQFWLPVAHQRTYPDFVALLNDGRVFVIEYKGGDRFSNDDSRAKDAVGKLWAAKSGGRAVYLMAQLQDAQGRNIREQLLAAIAGRS